MSSGKLYLIPVPLGPTDPTSLSAIIPTEVLAVVRQLDHFVVENAKTARSTLKLYGHPLPLRDIQIKELNEHTNLDALPEFLQAMQGGKDLGLMSEAGCPAVADPGSALVELAHKHSIRIVPLTGPSSILLALMGSGMNGQRFSFRGYLPAREPDRLLALKNLERDSKRANSVEIFIETPYRNNAMLEACLQLGSGTRLCIACDLTLPTEWIHSAPIADWKSRPPTEAIDRRPAVFLIQAK